MGTHCNLLAPERLASREPLSALLVSSLHRCASMLMSRKRRKRTRYRKYRKSRPALEGVGSSRYTSHLSIIRLGGDSHNFLDSLNHGDDRLDLWLKLI